MLHARARTELSRLAVLGLGAIGRTLVDRLLDGAIPRSRPAILAYVKAHRVDDLRARYAERIQLTTSLDELISFDPDVVIEAAGQPAIRELAEPILAAGLDLMLVSTGALVDIELRSRLTAAAASSGRECSSRQARSRALMDWARYDIAAICECDTSPSNHPMPARHARRGEDRPWRRAHGRDVLSRICSRGCEPVSPQRQSCSDHRDRRSRPRTHDR